MDTKFKVLIVDDTPKNLQIIGTLLTEENYDISFANNGLEAYNTAKNVLPDLILLDVMMPVMDGFESCAKIKDDLINVGGYKVSPHLVENIIRKLDSIVEAMVVPQKNSISGNLVKAIICLKPGEDQQNVRKEILKVCKAELPSYCIPRLLEFVNKITLTETQKLKRT